jgi:serine/threonine protein kinase
MFSFLTNFLRGQSSSAYELDPLQRTPFNSPRTPLSLSTGSAPSTSASPFLDGQKLYPVFDRVFCCTGTAQGKGPTPLSQITVSVKSKKLGMKDKDFLVHPDPLDAESVDALARPMVQLICKELKLDKSGEPKIYVMLTPKNLKSTLSQFFSENREILDLASNLGLAPKIKSVISRQDPTAAKGEPGVIEDQRPLLVEFMPGGDLLNFLADHPELTKEQRIDLAKQAVRIVRDLHSMHIAHRDIKPENFLVGKLKDDGFYDLKIIDFGFAVRNKEGVTDRCYSPGYMDPAYWQSFYLQKRYRIGGVLPPIEQKPLSPYKSDCWSLGATLYFLFFSNRYERSLSNIYPNTIKSVKNEHLFILEKQKRSNDMIRFAKDSYPDTIIDVLIGLLQHIPEERLTAAQALELLEIPSHGLQAAQAIELPEISTQGLPVTQALELLEIPSQGLQQSQAIELSEISTQGLQQSQAIELSEISVQLLQAD